MPIPPAAFALLVIATAPLNACVPGGRDTTATATATSTADGAIDGAGSGGKDSGAGGRGGSGGAGKPADSGAGGVEGGVTPADAGADAAAGSSGAAATDGAAGTGSGCTSCPSDFPHCSFQQCVQCNDDEHCAKGVCEDNTCVPCRAEADCSDPAAPRCSNNQCSACIANGDCLRFATTPVCSEGNCVQCDGDDYEACGSNATGTALVCDTLTQSCSTALEHSANLCDPCITDAQCQPGQLCVQQTYDDPNDTPDKGEQNVGHFCFWREDSTQTNAPGGTCANAVPFFATRTVTSIDGAQATVCGLRATTCTGYKHYSSKPCASPADDATCGDPRFPSDGQCDQAATDTYLCTTPCLSELDCKPGATCSATNVCSLQ
jgi:hypothetical protein